MKKLSCFLMLFAMILLFACNTKTAKQTEVPVDSAEVVSTDTRSELDTLNQSTELEGVVAEETPVTENSEEVVK